MKVLACKDEELLSFNIHIYAECNGHNAEMCKEKS